MREEYREKRIFESVASGGGECSLEAVVRSAAQRMIQTGITGHGG